MERGSLPQAVASCSQLSKEPGQLYPLQQKALFPTLAGERKSGRRQTKRSWDTQRCREAAAHVWRAQPSHAEPLPEGSRHCPALLASPSTHSPPES